MCDLQNKTAFINDLVRDLQNKTAFISVEGSDMIVEGANFVVRNGLGSTESTNGLGNLVVGYNEMLANEPRDRSGSHNIVTGERHAYISYGSIISGINNTATLGHAVR